MKNDLVKKRGENSQPSLGVGQRLPGTYEINSPGISVESIFRDLEQPGGEPAPQPAEAAQPGQGPVDMGPTAESLKKRIAEVLRTNRRPQTRILEDVFDTLQLERASREKLLIIKFILNMMEENRDYLRKKGERFDIYLTVKVREMLDNR